MIRPILSSLFFLLSLLTIFPVPAKQVWYLGIAVSEFPWIWIIAVILLLIWNLRCKKYRLVTFVVNLASLLLFSLPLVQAGYYRQPPG